MLIERHRITGAWMVSDIIEGQRIARTYYGFTKRQATQEFRAEVKRLFKKRKR